jgi:hypothetical protein
VGGWDIFSEEELARRGDATKIMRAVRALLAIGRTQPMAALRSSLGFNPAEIRRWRIVIGN